MVHNFTELGIMPAQPPEYGGPDMDESHKFGLNQFACEFFVKGKFAVCGHQLCIISKRGGNDNPVLRVAVMFRQIHS